MNDTEYKVLMIDDDELIARSTSEYFNILGLKTAYVTSYDAAVEFLDTHEISLLLLDINLGDRSGFDLCKKVRENYDMPILFISARTSDDDVIIALNIGGDDYIKKPYTLGVLFAKVKAILGRYEKAKEAALTAASSVSSKNIGQQIRDRLLEDATTPKKVVYIDAEYDEICGTEDEVRKQAQQEVSNIVRTGLFQCDILITTAVLDNGVNIKDEKVKNIVLMTDDEDEFLQMMGRKRFINQDEILNLFISMGDIGQFKK